VVKTDDWASAVLIAAVAALLGLGAIMIFSTTARGDGPLVSVTFTKQLACIALSVYCAVALARRDYRVILARHRAILAVAAALLLLVLVPGVGRRINGASRWLGAGPVSFQPSEFAKLALVVFLAGFLSSRGERLTSFKAAFFPSIVVVGLVCALILFEPDIGTTFLVAAVAWIVLFVAGSRMIFLFGPMLAAVPVLLVLVSEGYAKARIDAWLNPLSDPSGSGYHIRQSLIAVGSGGLWGVGLGHSTQKLLFLPEASTDFIFAILAEELGLIGVTAVLVLYCLVICSGIMIARRAADVGGMLLAAGITSVIALQAAINVAVVTKVLPPKGIALPFISSGGSALLFMLMGVGLLYSVAHASKPQASV